MLFLMLSQIADPYIPVCIVKIITAEVRIQEASLPVISFPVVNVSFKCRTACLHETLVQMVAIVIKDKGLLGDANPVVLT